MRPPRSALVTEQNMALLADYYEFTMGKADLDHANNARITENYFIRKIPQGAYLLTAGLEQVVHYVQSLTFQEEDLEWLQRTSGKDMSADLMDYFRHFKFSGDIYAAPEGTPVFPQEPIINVTGPSLDVQLFETYLLNVMNYQGLVATKASRIVEAAKGRVVLDFGSRRAHGRDAAVLGARAAYIGGAQGTSLVLAGRLLDIPYVGTMAHKFIQDRDSEIQAFRDYAESFPHNCIFLIDTYDTIQGAKNAVIVAKELEAKGHKLKGVRLDSGNLLHLSTAVRQIFDEAGLDYVNIFASNDLDEYLIESLLCDKAPIDGFGVGTRLITGANYNPLIGQGGVSALGGIYKHVEREELERTLAKMKFSNDKGKSTLPSRKQVSRLLSPDGRFLKDVIHLWDEQPPKGGIPLLQPIVLQGQQVYDFPSLQEIQAYATAQKAKLPRQVKTLNPLDPYDRYDVQISEGLTALMQTLIKQQRGEPV